MSYRPSEDIPRLERRLVRRERAVEVGTGDPAKNKRRLKTARNDLFKAILRRGATPAEKVVRQYLVSIGQRHLFQKGFFSPWHIIADFYFSRKKLILEIDGGYHKARAKQDRERDEAFLRRRGIRTLRVTNEDVFSGRYKIALAREGIHATLYTEDSDFSWIR